MDISLLMEPQAKHRRMYRGDSMYSEQSLLELEAMPCKDCKRTFAPKTYVKHFDSRGKPKCKSTTNKKRPVYNSAKARIENNAVLNKDEKERALLANKNITRDLALLKLKSCCSASAALLTRNDQNLRISKWRMDSKSLRDAIRAIRANTRKKKKHNDGKGKIERRRRNAHTRNFSVSFAL